MNWIARNVRRGTQHEARAFNELFPEFRKRVVSLQKEKLDIVSKIAELRITGPQTKDDWVLLYMIANGMVKLPTSIKDIMGLWDPTAGQFGGARQLTAPEYIRGIFSPARFITSEQNIAASQQEALANMSIPGIDSRNLWGNAQGNNAVTWQSMFRPEDRSANPAGANSLLAAFTNNPAASWRGAAGNNPAFAAPSQQYTAPVPP